ncbi:hypothetical protein [Fibrella arboris]|uniref:hypothetical protein n=1 Tax=Fibrella arboris TaxID=3242486 RepID=UPI003522C1B2
MKKILFAILIMMAVTAELLAGSPTWNIGYVILPDGHKLEGQLSYNWKVEVVQVRMDNGLMKAYSAGHIDSFAFYDANQRLVRKFSSVDLSDAEEGVRPVFMEEVASGPLTVYRRLRHTHEFIKILRPSVYSDDTELLKDIDNFTYLVIDQEGQVFNMALFNLDLWPRMVTYHGQLSDYIKLRDVDPATTLARLLIINQYNFLSAGVDSKPQPRTAQSD